MPVPLDASIQARQKPVPQAASEKPECWTHIPLLFLRELGLRVSSQSHRQVCIMSCPAGPWCSLLLGFMLLWATGSSELVSGFLPKASGLWILVKSAFPVGEEWHPEPTPSSWTTSEAAVSSWCGRVVNLGLLVPR